MLFLTLRSILNVKRYVFDMSINDTSPLPPDDEPVAIGLSFRTSTYQITKLA